ncbi:MAG: 16S rRNA (adenine(1518)-N(6)/adenine(1519)-N(6))-dimethyltransferase RsmA [candidate division WOR-3 bacterium]
MRLKKSLSQHLLWNKKVAEKIVNFARIESNDEIVEIGSGTGILTRAMAIHAKKIYAVEIDREMVKILKKNLAGFNNIEIIEQDFLTLTIAHFNRPLIIGNIPYRITTRIIKKLIDERDFFARAILTMQREYAQRLLARPGNKEYGSMTIFTGYHFRINRGFLIPPGQFRPRPKVSSMVVEFIRREINFGLEPDDLNGFFDFVKRLFCYRRKKISTIVKKLYGIALIYNRRPEELEIEELINLYNNLRVPWQRF